jgi:hydroxymethylglutaryl-CoA lyase
MNGVALQGLPARVEIVEVGPRDGLQNESAVLSTAVKAELIDRLVRCGLHTVEVTSMVRPDLVPQLADGEALLDLIPRSDGVRYPVLVPNLRGLDRAMAHGVRDIAVFASATETFAQRNLGRSVEESLAMFAPVVERAKAAGLGVRGYLSMCYVDPWEGIVAPEQVAAVGARLVEMGCDELSLGDTIGAATPGQVVKLLDTLTAGGIRRDQMAVHFHDTYGQALSNTLVALQQGITIVDSSAGGLGGCPFAKSATGNLATEDLIWQLDGLGIETGVHLGALVATSTWLAGLLGRPSPSAVVRAFNESAEDAADE